MGEAKTFLQDARNSFRLASEAKGPKEIERYAAMGRNYLHLAHQAAEVEPKQNNDPQPSLWRLP
jgi:hypothetical protein